MVRLGDVRVCLNVLNQLTCLKWQHDWILYDQNTDALKNYCKCKRMGMIIKSYKDSRIRFHFADFPILPDNYDTCFEEVKVGVSNLCWSSLAQSSALPTLPTATTFLLVARRYRRCGVEDLDRSFHCIVVVVQHPHVEVEQTIASLSRTTKQGGHGWRPSWALDRLACPCSSPGRVYDSSRLSTLLFSCCPLSSFLQPLSEEFFY